MREFTKPLILVAVIITLLVMASCSKDESPEPAKEEVAEKPVEAPKEEAQDPTEGEEQPAEEAPSQEHGTETSDKIACNVTIKGGTRIEGLPPMPNGAISMDLSRAGAEAYLNEGFDIPIVSDADVIGAYIQFRAKDEGISTSYYDVNLQDNTAFSAKAAKQMVARTFKGSRKSAKPVNSNLDIDFSPEITPGEFCYLICVYDANGNISEPQEVCITVNAWGGNDNLLGMWSFTKSESYSFDAEPEVRPIGVERCFSQVFGCSNGNTLDYVQCSTKEYETFTFNTDGTYTHTFGNFGKEMDAVASDVNCEIVLVDTIFSFIINGNWFYNTENEELIVVEYETNYNGSNGPFMQVAEPGEAEIFDLPNLVVDGNVFTWGFPLGTDLNADGEINADDGGYANFFEKQ